MGRLYRSDKGVIAGVCAGIAESFKLNATLVRTIFLLLVFCSFGAAAIAYLILWFLMPQNKSSRKSYEERLRERLDK